MKLSILAFIPVLTFLTSTTANCSSPDPTKKDIAGLREWISKYQAGEVGPPGHRHSHSQSQPSTPTQTQPSGDSESEYTATPVANIKQSPETTTISSPPSIPPSFPISDTAKNYRLRAQSSVNLGGWVVTESWLNPGLYDCAEGGVGELSLARGCDAATLQNHWDTWVTDKDFDALQALGINTVRLPIGYWTLGRDNCNCESSKFWPYIDKYAGQWSYVLKAVDWAGQRGMGVLIDLHGAQGSQNTWDHSGENTAKPGSSNFITNPTNRDATKNVIKWVVEQLKDKENIVGIELLNEATEDSGLLAQWYGEVSTDIQNIAGLDFPIYIWAGFRGQGAYWQNWVQGRPGFFVLDLHPYYLWSADWKKVSVDKIIDTIGGPDRDNLMTLAPNIILGEWGCALEGNSTAEREGFDRQGEYCDAQLELYTSQAAGGWHYWNIHAVGEGTPWDFLQATSVREGHNRPLIRPAHGAPSFDPAVRQDGSSGFAHKRSMSALSMIAQRAQAQRQQAKRDSYVGDHGHAVQVWDEGCEVAKIFGEAGSVLGFPSEWIRHHQLAHEDFSGSAYADHFTNGLRSCEW